MGLLVASFSQKLLNIPVEKCWPLLQSIKDWPRSLTTPKSLVGIWCLSEWKSRPMCWYLGEKCCVSPIARCFLGIPWFGGFMRFTLPWGYVGYVYRLCIASCESPAPLRTSVPAVAEIPKWCLRFVRKRWLDGWGMLGTGLQSCLVKIGQAVTGGRFFW